MRTDGLPPGGAFANIGRTEPIRHFAAGKLCGSFMRYVKDICFFLCIEDVAIGGVFPRDKVKRSEFAFYVCADLAGAEATVDGRCISESTKTANIGISDMLPL